MTADPFPFDRIALIDSLSTLWILEREIKNCTHNN